jgi:hypothetical protein
MGPGYPATLARAVKRGRVKVLSPIGQAPVVRARDGARHPAASTSGRITPDGVAVLPWGHAGGLAPPLGTRGGRREHAPRPRMAAGGRTYYVLLRRLGR